MSQTYHSLNNHLAQLLANMIRPRSIVGTGYTNPRTVARRAIHLARMLCLLDLTSMPLC